MITVTIDHEWFKTAHAACEALDDDTLTEMRRLVEDGIRKQVQQHLVSAVWNAIEDASRTGILKCHTA